MQDIPRVSIIILNWNDWKETIECLESLYKLSYENFDLILIDNGSSDDSVNKILGYTKGLIKLVSPYVTYSSTNKPIEVFLMSENEAKKCNVNVEKYTQISPHRRIIMILNKKNLGYVGGMNIGIRFSMKFLKPSYLLILNNDTITKHPNFLRALVELAESNKRIGVVGPKVINYYTEKIVPQEQIIIPLPLMSFLIRLFPRRFDSSCSSLPLEVYRLDGSCYLVRSDVFEKIGLFDERFFAYFEDTDFFTRARKAGFIIAYNPSTTIWHRIGSGRTIERRFNSLALYMFSRNILHFIHKHFDSRLIRLILKTYITLIFIPYMVCITFIMSGNFRIAKYIVLGFARGLLGEVGRPELRICGQVV